MDTTKPFKLLKPWACTITNALVEEGYYYPGKLEQRVLEQLPPDYVRQTETDLKWEPEKVEPTPVVDVVEEPGTVIPTIKEDPDSDGIAVKKATKKVAKSEEPTEPLA